MFLRARARVRRRLQIFFIVFIHVPVAISNVQINSSSQRCRVPECEELLRHLLVLNPERRYGFREIVSHKWMTNGADDVEFIRLMDESQDVARDIIDRPLDVGVLQHMKRLGMDISQVTSVSTHDWRFISKRRPRGD
jgi:hypothetical protein